MALKGKRRITHLLLVVIAATGIFACNQHKKDKEGERLFTGYPFPKPIGFVSDFVHLFSKTEIDTLTRIIALNEQKTTNQIAIVTTNDTMVNKSNLTNYVTALFNNWGVGDKRKNNGVIICIFPRIRMLRIGTGYGIENKMTDAETAKIIDSIITPEYKKGSYYIGTKKGLLAVIDETK